MSSLAWLTIWGRADTGTHTSVVSDRQPEAVTVNKLGQQNKSSLWFFLPLLTYYREISQNILAHFLCL
jgi:hypothetical protein